MAFLPSSLPPILLLSLFLFPSLLQLYHIIVSDPHPILCFLSVSLYFIFPHPPPHTPSTSVLFSLPSSLLQPFSVLCLLFISLPPILPHSLLIYTPLLSGPLPYSSSLPSPSLLVLTSFPSRTAPSSPPPPRLISISVRHFTSAPMACLSTLCGRKRPAVRVWQSGGWCGVRRMREEDWGDDFAQKHKLSRPRVLHVHVTWFSSCTQARTSLSLLQRLVQGRVLLSHSFPPSPWLSLSPARHYFCSL